MCHGTDYLTLCLPWADLSAQLENEKNEKNTLNEINHKEMAEVSSHSDVGTRIDFLNVWLCIGGTFVDGQ